MHVGMSSTIIMAHIQITRTHARAKHTYTHTHTCRKTPKSKRRCPSWSATWYPTRCFIHPRRCFLYWPPPVSKLRLSLSLPLSLSCAQPSPANCPVWAARDPVASAAPARKRLSPMFILKRQCPRIRNRSLLTLWWVSFDGQCYVNSPMSSHCIEDFSYV
jgi:hypothetical protein